MRFLLGTWTVIAAAITAGATAAVSHAGEHRAVSDGRFRLERVRRHRDGVVRIRPLRPDRLISPLRRREYAIHVALGATRTQVWWLVVRQALALAIGRAVAGLAIAVSATGVLQGTLHGVEPTDTATFATAATAVVALAVIASGLPAFRAGRINPIETLKAE